MADPATSASDSIRAEGRSSASTSTGSSTNASGSSKRSDLATSDDSVLDIETLTKRILAVLSKYRISQLVFGERVVGCSQGHLHNLLWKPKPFSLLSAHGKRPYYKMQAFLDDDGLEERISQLTSLRGASSRRRPSPEDEDMDNEIPGRPPRKKRVTFTIEQRLSLEEFFEENSYPSRDEIEEIASNLKIPIDTVRFWFNNKRRLEKKRRQESELMTEGGDYNEEDQSDQEEAEEEEEEQEVEEEDNDEEEEQVAEREVTPRLVPPKKALSRGGNNGSAHLAGVKPSTTAVPSIRPPGPAGASAKLAMAPSKLS